MTQIRIDELERHLRGPLAPVWLVAGEEPLLIEEARAAIRAAARTAGYSERVLLYAQSSGFDWRNLGETASNLSLFSERRLIELHLPGGKPGSAGAQALREYCSVLPADTLLLVVTDRLDARQRSSAWVETLARIGVLLYIWPIGLSEFPRWLERRLRARGLTARPEVIEVLVGRSEGNLLAAAQEVDKLHLLLGEGRVDLAMVRSAVADSARFDVFDLAEAALSGNQARVDRVCRCLRQEGAEPTLVLWALARELRVLALLQAVAGEAGQADSVYRRFRVPRQRQGRLWHLANATPSGTWERLLSRAARTDRIIKGAEAGRPWDELLQLSIELTALIAAA